MKIGKILAVAAVATVFASCSNEEELANVGKSESNAIRFAGISGLSDTRTTPIGTHNLTSTNFDVMAFMSSDNALFMGGKHEAGHSDQGVKIVYNTTAWDYDDPDKVAYWPTSGDVDFYAVSPAITNDLVHNHYFGYDMRHRTITYTTVDEYNSPGTNHDVMYAVTKGRNKENNGATAVQMKFKHILSQVVFKAKTKQSTLTVDVKNIKIHNFVHGGTFKLPTDEPAMSDWSLSPAAAGAYTVKLNAANVVVTNNTAVDLSDMNSPLMMIPQQLTKWSTSAGTAVSKLEADNAKECYLEIAMKLKQNDSYIIGSATGYTTVYVPFDNGTGWEPGKRYIYTLIFGGGYDDQGKPILSPITFNAATADWVDASAGADVNVNF